MFLIWQFPRGSFPSSFFYCPFPKTCTSCKKKHIKHLWNYKIITPKSTSVIKEQYGRDILFIMMVSRAKNILIILDNVYIIYNTVRKWHNNLLNVYFLTKDFVSTSRKVSPKRTISMILLSLSVLKFRLNCLIWFTGVFLSCEEGEHWRRKWKQDLILPLS